MLKFCDKIYEKTKRINVALEAICNPIFPSNQFRSLASCHICVALLKTKPIWLKSHIQTLSID